MSKLEIQAFQNEPFFREILQVRLCDEKAKRTHFNCASLDTYIPLMKQHLLSQNQ